MKNINLLATAVALAIILPACKSKKPINKSSTANQQVQTVIPVNEAKPQATPSRDDQKILTVDKPAKPDYSFTNLQFEFNSAILKTSSYPMLDKIALEMAKDPSVKFVLNGYASAEGTPQHNMELSEQRAAAVKTYLLNAGVADNQVKTKGFGERNPIKPNTTEQNRAINRRVEITRY